DSELNVNASGTLNYGGRVALMRLTHSAAGGITLRDQFLVASSPVTFNDAVTLAANTTFDVAGITFNSTVTGPHALTVNTTGGGTTRFNGDVNVQSASTNA